MLRKRQWPGRWSDRHRDVHWRVDNVTEKLNTDQAIREEHDKLIDFTDNAPVGFFSVDEEGRFIFVNATLARWLGEDIRNILRSGYLHTYFDRPPEPGYRDWSLTPSYCIMVAYQWKLW